MCVCVCVCVCVYFTLSKRNFCNYPENLNPFPLKHKTYCWYTNCYISYARVEVGEPLSYTISIGNALLGCRI